MYRLFLCFLIFVLLSNNALSYNDSHALDDFGTFFDAIGFVLVITLSVIHYVIKFLFGSEFYNNNKTTIRRTIFILSIAVFFLCFSEQSTSTIIFVPLLIFVTNCIVTVALTDDTNTTKTNNFAPTKQISKNTITITNTTTTKNVDSIKETLDKHIGASITSSKTHSDNKQTQTTETETHTDQCAEPTNPFSVDIHKISQKERINEPYLTHLKQKIRSYDICSFEIPESMNPYTKIQKIDKNFLGIVDIHLKEYDELRYMSPKDCKEAVDLNMFLASFRFLKMKPGYVLDYIYWKRPLIYARKETEKPVRTATEFKVKFGFDEDVYIRDAEDCIDVVDYPEFTYQNAFIEHMVVDDSPEALFELSLFLSSITRFYLYDHDLYEKLHYIYSQEDFDNLLYSMKHNCFPFPARNYSEQDAEQATHIDYRPHFIKLTNGTVFIAILTENAWKGVRWQITKFTDGRAVETSFVEEIQSNCNVLL